MINISDEFKKAMKQPIKELDAYILLEDETKITSADDLISFKISCETSLCKTAMKKVECKYLGTHNLLGEWVHFVFGVKISDGTFEYLDYGAFQVNEITTSKDTGITTIVAYDKMIKSMIEYKPLNITYPTTLYDFTKSLVEDCGLELKNTSFNANSDFPISQELFSNIQGITYRDIFTQIAEATASTCIISEDKLYFKPIFETNEDLTYDNMFTLNLENKYGEINSIVLARTPQEDNIYLKDDESIGLNGLTEFRIENNDIVDKNREIAIIDIFNQLNGVSYYPFETSTEGLGWYEIGDKLTIINDNEEEFDVVLFNFCISIDGSIKEILKTSEPSKTRSQYQYASSIDKKVKNTELIVDKQNGKIESVIEQTNEQNQKIAQVTQTVEELNSKIGDIADITISAENTNAKIELNEINQSEPIRLVIKPIREDISYLYPSNDLYPSDDLYMTTRTIRFHNNTTEENFDYELPDDLLYYDSENYDEFIFDYDGQTCVINKKIGYNSDGTTYVLDEMITISYDFPKILLTDGDYTISILGYDTGYIFARLMTKNIYTTQFYTKAEVDSEISQTSQEINLSVNSKLENYSTTNEMNSAIKMSASSITSSVSESYATKNELKEAQSTIKQTTDAIELEVSEKVSTDEVIDTINSSSGEVINSSKISLTNKNINLTSDNVTINSTNFSVDKNGNMKCVNGDFSGTISASTISGNTISGGSISGTSISGTTINGGTVSGTSVNTTSGSIGGFNLSSNGLYKNKTTLGSSTKGVFIGTNGFNFGDSSHYLKMGALTSHPEASGLNITGSAGINMGDNGLSNCSLITSTAGDRLTIRSASSASEAGRVRTEVPAGLSNIDFYSSNANINMKQIYNHVIVDSSKNMKKDIEKITDDETLNIYDTIKNIHLYKYKYKDEYNEERKETYYGFMIEDLENTEVNNILHFKQDENDKNVKTFETAELPKLNLLLIKQLQEEIEKLKGEIKILKKEENNEKTIDKHS